MFGIDVVSALAGKGSGLIGRAGVKPGVSSHSDICRCFGCRVFGFCQFFPIFWQIALEFGVGALRIWPIRLCFFLLSSFSVRLPLCIIEFVCFRGHRKQPETELYRFAKSIVGFSEPIADRCSCQSKSQIPSCQRCAICLSTAIEMKSECDMVRRCCWKMQ